MAWNSDDNNKTEYATIALANIRVGFKDCVNALLNTIRNFVLRIVQNIKSIYL